MAHGDRQVATDRGATSAEVDTSGVNAADKACLAAMTHYRATPDAVFAEVPGGGVVLHTGTKRYYSLNPTGARIWALLESTSDPGNTAAVIATEYGISTSEAQQAVEDLVKDFVKAGLLGESDDVSTGG